MKLLVTGTGGFVGTLLRDAETMRFLRFLIVGGLNTVVGYALFVGLTFLGLAQNPAVIGATILGILFNFGSIGRLVFGQGALGLLPRFVAVYLVQCLLNIGLLTLATKAGVPSIVAEAAILPVLAALVFLLMRRFVFRQDAR